MKKSFSLLVKILVTVAILVFLFFKVNFNTTGFWDTLMGIDLPIYLLSLFGVVFVLGIKSYRWKILISNEGYNYKAYRAFGAYMSSDAIGIVTPGRIGEISRLYYVRQETDIPFFQAFKTIVSDRIFDFTMLGWFGVSGVTYYLKTFGDLPGTLYVLIVLGCIVVGYIVGMKLLGFFVRKKWLARWQIPLFIYDCFRAVVSKRFVAMWLITIVAYIAYFFFSWLIMLSLRVKPEMTDVAFIMSLMSLSTILPISIAGFGTREATLVFLFARYGFSSEIAVSFSLLHFTAFFLWGGLIGLFYWLTMPISLQQVKDDSLLIFKLFKLQPKESGDKAS
ncbi:MAG: flippase-like domain-containing protein [Bacteroidetes bacterium]|nr:flippase-like domain-containing protein [Bacteroidota bacterium]